MIRFLTQRGFQGIVVLLLVTFVTYALFFAGNPRNVAQRLAGRQATPETVDRVYENLGLDQPLPTQYWNFIGRLLHGDLGTDYYYGIPVTTVLKQGAPVTLSLVVGAALLWLTLGVASGVYSAVHPRSMADRIVTGVALVFFSIPVFVLGFGLIYALFYLSSEAGWDWLPAGDYVSLTADPLEWVRHMILPWLTLALVSAAAYTRLTRSAMLDVLGEDYVRTARAKGVGEMRVIVRHALRSALTPVLTQFGVDVGVALGGAILVESVFGLPGLGREAVVAITNQDLPVIIGIVIIAAVAVVLMNIIVDVLYALIDPRVRLR
ncbi:ABC transporter permease [Mycolicibacterium sp. P9-64]|uniref:ABC transporter permease n=1 Tax=Mycolicibacterium sp. P9-64 TaxID=2024612 RepID=UPI0011EE465E|nr:ABC transporter permease [Mycolicibacterium sp. P9-64]KAA0085282.1 ABC transporter permease [Mycolicibacterium sp. P9-64]